MIGFITQRALANPQSGVELNVPYVSQAPDGKWIAPWDEACEEASILMVEGYYGDRNSRSTEEVKQTMQRMFAWEEKTFKKKDDTDATETKQLIETHASFGVSIQRDPKLEDILTELRGKRPVMAMVNMLELYRDPSYSFDTYHVMVIIGFDDKRREFIVHDPAKRDEKRYTYDRLLTALHDFNPQSKEADGTPTVLFTNSKTASLSTISIEGFFDRLLNAIKTFFS